MYDRNKIIEESVSQKNIIFNQAHLPHAILFVGRQDDCDEEVDNLIKLLKIEPSDKIVLAGDESIKIIETRELVRQINLSPHSSEYKVAIIRNAQNLTLQASNSLLKTLEEPPQNSIIILCANNEENILLTIKSRCRNIKINKIGEIIIGETEKDNFTKISKMNVKEKFDLANKLHKENIVDETLNNWIKILREEMLVSKKNNKTLRNILDAKKILKKNVNNRLLMENILLEIK